VAIKNLSLFRCTDPHPYGSTNGIVDAGVMRKDFQPSRARAEKRASERRCASQLRIHVNWMSQIIAEKTWKPCLKKIILCETSRISHEEQSKIRIAEIIISFMSKFRNFIPSEVCS
jgi:hypothetical protein